MAKPKQSRDGQKKSQEAAQEATQEAAQEAAIKRKRKPSGRTLEPQSELQDEPQDEPQSEPQDEPRTNQEERSNGKGIKWIGECVLSRMTPNKKGGIDKAYLRASMLTEFLSLTPECHAFQTTTFPFTETFKSFDLYTTLSWLRQEGLCEKEGRSTYITVEHSLIKRAWNEEVKKTFI